jgi:hypothetical protein
MPSGLGDVNMFCGRAAIEPRTRGFDVVPSDTRFEDLG